jgi:hypothetical protein
MGLYDTVYCDYPLPDARHQDLEFQTKDLECLLGDYRITRDGRLMLQDPRRERRADGDSDIEWPLHGDISIHTSLDAVWVDYVVRFTHGRVEWILPREEAPAAPEFPSEWGLFSMFPESDEPEGEAIDFTPPATTPSTVVDAATPSAEEALLLSLRRDRPELEKLLKEHSDHWGYEDPIYRFYHQSFKVYGLQEQTQAIVQKLQALAPDLPLNPWFVQILALGTGKAFQSEDNAHWTEATRPILEAFFHARFFLEMAVRYADLPAPPQPLPSGYAALLYLFGLR